MFFYFYLRTYIICCKELEEENISTFIKMGYPEGLLKNKATEIKTEAEKIMAG